MIVNQFLPVSTIDYPGKIAAVMFTSPCNFNCPYCHNPELINLNPDWCDMDLIFARLPNLCSLIEGIVITGGEPTVSADLPELLQKLRAFHLSIKLDTNGSNPDMLITLLDNKLVDYISMDIKTSLNRYSELIDQKLNKEQTSNLEYNILKSIELLLASGIDYEFRTTAVPGLVTADDIANIVNLIPKAKLYTIQQFNNRVVNKKEYLDIIPYTKDILESYVTIAKKYINNVRLID